MLKAHKLLNAEELIVSIPRRTCMMVIDKNEPDQALVQKFIDLHFRAWDEEEYGNAPITNLLLMVKEGKVVGTVNVGK